MPAQNEYSPAAAASAVNSAELPESFDWRMLAAILLLVVLALIAYFPSLGGGFILDDDLLLTHNPLIKAHDGIFRFWYTTQQPDYVPLTSSVLWLEWRLWGLDPTGYHIVNLLLHVVACLLLWNLLHRLAIPGEYLAALLYAVHPVNVESVAWVEQLKDTLSLVLFLLSIGWYLQAEEEANRGRAGTVRWLWYGASLSTFLLAMFSKGSVATLPLMLLLIAWWQRGRITRQDFLRTAPYFAVAVVLSPVILWFVTHGTNEAVRIAAFTERLAGAGAVVWFYLSKALLPIKLIFVYPMWDVRADDPLWWVPLTGALAFTVALFQLRNFSASNWIRAVLFAWIFYGLALAPVAGFSDPGYAKYSLVADHYQHIALVAVVTLSAAGICTWRAHTLGAKRRVPVIVAILMVGTSAVLAWQQSRLYRSSFTLYEATLKDNPRCWLAHNLLGNELLATGHLPEAIAHLEKSLEIKPDSAIAHVDLGAALYDAGRIPEAIDHYQQALKLKPDNAEAIYNIGDAMLKTGQLAKAIEVFQQAVQLSPQFTEAYLGLGTAENMLGHPQDALQYFQHALSIDPDHARVYASMANSYAQLQQSDNATAAAEKALQLARSQDDEALAQQIEGWLQFYRTHQAIKSQAPASQTTPDSK